jgi:hypothetical protein
MAHTVDNFTISCIDFRFRAKIAEWIKNELGDQSDLVAIAGVSKAILDDDTRAAVLKQIGIAERLHEIKTVHLVDHIDCGAYGGSAKFEGDKDAEVAMHHEELSKAADVIKAEYPSLAVETHIIDFEGMI